MVSVAKRVVRDPALVFYSKLVFGLMDALLSLLRQKKVGEEKHIFPFSRKEGREKVITLLA